VVGIVALGHDVGTFNVLARVVFTVVGRVVGTVVETVAMASR
jgi:hypothetical protein